MKTWWKHEYAYDEAYENCKQTQCLILKTFEFLVA